ncbi:MAG: RrF2 family transcriptional regulator [Pirellulales bacterium]
MRLSAKTEYASLAMLELARRQDDEQPARLREIAEAQGVPSRFLVHILLQLKAAGLVTSTRGAFGGYRLARDASSITLADIHDVFDGPRDVSTSLGQDAPLSRASQVLLDAWQGVARREYEALESLDLATLASQVEVTDEAMYYI